MFLEINLKKTRKNKTKNTKKPLYTSRLAVLLHEILHEGIEIIRLFIFCEDNLGVNCPWRKCFAFIRRVSVAAPCTHVHLFSPDLNQWWRELNCLVIARYLRVLYVAL